MSDTKAGIGYGTVLELADLETPTDFEYVAEISNLTVPSETTDQVDVTHMQSPHRTREFIDGLTDPGEVSFEMNYVPGSDADLLILSTKGKRKWCRITFPNGVRVMFIGLRQSYEKTAPTDDKMTASVAFKVSGVPHQTAAAAPMAIEDPGITGTAQVGSPLLLNPGIWAGALATSIQWKISNGTGFDDISGATGASYIPVVGDVGKTIMAVVTGSNDSFSTIAESDPTSAVIS